MSYDSGKKTAANSITVAKNGAYPYVFTPQMAQRVRIWLKRMIEVADARAASGRLPHDGEVQ